MSAPANRGQSEQRYEHRQPRNPIAASFVRNLGLDLGIGTRSILDLEFRVVAGLQIVLLVVHRVIPGFDFWIASTISVVCGPAANMGVASG